MLMVFDSGAAALAKWRQDVATRMQAVMCANFILLATRVPPSPLGSDTYACKVPQLTTFSHAHACAHEQLLYTVS